MELIKKNSGKKELLSIAQMIASESQIYIIDEPFSAMDKNIAEYMQQQLLQLKDKMIIMITHKTDEDSLALFDHVYEMQGGGLSVATGQFMNTIYVIGTSVAFRAILFYGSYC